MVQDAGKISKSSNRRRVVAEESSATTVPKYKDNDDTESESEEFASGTSSKYDNEYGYEGIGFSDDDIDYGYDKQDDDNFEIVKTVDEKRSSRKEDKSRKSQSRNNGTTSSDYSKSDCSRRMSRGSGHSTCSSKVDSVDSSRRRSSCSTSKEDIVLHVKSKRLERRGSVGASHIPLNDSEHGNKDMKNSESNNEDNTEIVCPEELSLSTKESQRRARPNRRRASINISSNERVVNSSCQSNLAGAADNSNDSRHRSSSTTTTANNVITSSSRRRSSTNSTNSSLNGSSHRQSSFQPSRRRASVTIVTTENDISE